MKKILLVSCVLLLIFIATNPSGSSFHEYAQIKAVPFVKIYTARTSYWFLFSFYEYKILRFNVYNKPYYTTVKYTGALNSFFQINTNLPVRQKSMAEVWKNIEKNGILNRKLFWNEYHEDLGLNDFDKFSQVLEDENKMLIF